MNRVTLTVALMAWGLVSVIGADDGQATDEAAIRKAVAAYVAAFNQGDARALAALWSREAVYTNPLSGEQVVGRAAIEQQFSAIEGMVDKASQRAAWNVVGKTRPIMETGIVKLTEDTAPVLVHFADGQTQQWRMVRLEEPTAKQ